MPNLECNEIAISLQSWRTLGNTDLVRFKTGGLFATDASVPFLAPRKGTEASASKARSNFEYLDTLV